MAVVEEGQRCDGAGTRNRKGGLANEEEWAVIEEGAPAEVYGRYLEVGKLGFQRCEDCSSAVFYPRVLCPACGGASLRWETSGGRGTVYATTAVYRKDGQPYNVALVDLEEGFRMMSRVEGMPAEEVEVGMEVAFMVRAGEDGPLAVFEPAENVE